MRKVIHLIESLDDNYGGPAKSVPYLAHYCANRGWETLLMSGYLSDAESNEVITEKGLEWRRHKLTGPRKLRYAPTLRHELNYLLRNAQGSTILHLHNLWNYPSYLAFAASRRSGVPLIVSVRGSLFPWSLQQGSLRKRLAWRAFQKRCLASAAAVHVTSEDEARAVRDLGIDGNIVCIPNGVELGSPYLGSQHEAKISLGLSLQTRYVSFISRLHVKKGIELLLHAWASTARGRGWGLLIAGSSIDKEYGQYLFHMAQQLNIEDEVKFLGFLKSERKACLMRASEIFVLPSYSENFGIAVAEALSAGLPVITTNNTPWTMLDSEGAGWCIPSEVTALTVILDQALSKNNYQLAQMGERAKLIAANYTWDKAASEMDLVYLDIQRNWGARG